MVTGRGLIGGRTVARGAFYTSDRVAARGSVADVLVVNRGRPGSWPFSVVVMLGVPLVIKLAP